MCYMSRHQGAGSNKYRLLLAKYVITTVYVSVMLLVTRVTQISTQLHSRSPLENVPQQL
jgi:hypothetical protein